MTLTNLILGFWALFPGDDPPPQPAFSHTEAQQISEAIEVAARAHEVAPALLAAVAEHESRYDPRAVSKTGDWGLFQLNPRSVWSARAAVICRAAPVGPALCLLAQANEAAALLHTNRRTCGRWRWAVAAYHTGTCRSPKGEAYARRVYKRMRHIRVVLTKGKADVRF